MSMISRIAQLFRWNPINRTVKIQIEESDLSRLIGATLFVRIVAIDDKNMACVELISASDSLKESINSTTLWIQPRHAGYDFFHLFGGSIAVYLSRSKLDRNDVRFASGVARVATISTA